MLEVLPSSLSSRADWTLKTTISRPTENAIAAPITSKNSCSPLKYYPNSLDLTHLTNQEAMTDCPPGDSLPLRQWARDRGLIGSCSVLQKLHGRNSIADWRKDCSKREGRLPTCGLTPHWKTVSLCNPKSLLLPRLRRLPCDRAVSPGNNGNLRRAVLRTNTCKTGSTRSCLNTVMNKNSMPLLSTPL